MITTELQTNNPDLQLIAPDVERDASLGVEWFNGKLGRKTLLLMGNPEQVVDKILPTILEDQTEIVTDFIERKDQLNWMIAYSGKVVGSVWVNLEPIRTMLAPSVHIMIGDPEMRGKGIGSTTLSTVIEYLSNQGFQHVYSRHLTNNEPIQKVFSGLNFRILGDPYIEDGLEFQNVVNDISS